MGCGRRTYAVTVELKLVSSLLVSSEPYELSLSVNSLSTSRADSLSAWSLSVAMVCVVYRKATTQKSTPNPPKFEPPTYNTSSSSTLTLLGYMHLNARPLQPRGRHMLWRHISCISAVFICVLVHGLWRIDCGGRRDPGLVCQHSPKRQHRDCW